MSMEEVCEGWRIPGDVKITFNRSFEYTEDQIDRLVSEGAKEIRISIMVERVDEQD